jgi:hypothetical protein
MVKTTIRGRQQVLGKVLYLVLLQAKQVPDIYIRHISSRNLSRLDMQ